MSYKIEVSVKVFDEQAGVYLEDEAGVFRKDFCNQYNQIKDTIINSLENAKEDVGIIFGIKQKEQEHDDTWS